MQIEYVNGYKGNRGKGKKDWRVGSNETGELTHSMVVFEFRVRCLSVVYRVDRFVLVSSMLISSVPGNPVNTKPPVT